MICSSGAFGSNLSDAAKIKLKPDHLPDVGAKWGEDCRQQNANGVYVSWQSARPPE